MSIIIYILEITYVRYIHLVAMMYKVLSCASLPTPCSVMSYQQLEIAQGGVFTEIGQCCLSCVCVFVSRVVFVCFQRVAY